MGQVFLSYRHAAPDEQLAKGLHAYLQERGLQVFLDKQIKIGLIWAAEIDRQLRASDSFVVFLSEDSIRSDMLLQEVQTAYELRQDGKLSIFPVRVDFKGRLPYDLAAYLNRLQYAYWQPGDSETELFALLYAAITGGAALPVVPSSEEADSDPLSGPRQIGGQDRHRPIPTAGLPSKGGEGSNKRLFSWRILAVLSVLSLGVALLVPLGRGANWGRQLTMAAFNRAELPLSASESKRLDSLIDLLGETLYQRYQRSIQQDGPFMDGWEGAQILVALDGLNLPRPLDFGRAAQFFQKTRSADCHCWKERPWEATGRAHIGSTAWVIYAKARLGISAEPDEVRFLLSNQNPDGAWPMFPCRENDSGSTYATAWTLLALGEQEHRGLVKEPLLAEVRNAVRSGLTWLETHRVQDGFWKSYPGLVWSDDASLSNSGLAIYVLHRLQSKTTREVDRDIDHRWMATLSPRPGPVYTWEAYNGFLCEKENPQAESVHYLVVPWRIVATVETYPQGSLVERQHAIDFAETLIARENLLAETKSQGWVAAELLISLRHLRSRYLSN